MTESLSAAGEPATIFERDLNMKIHNEYSPILACLHDELEPIGSIGRGCHHSVFEVPQWHDILGKALKNANRQRFGVIWDEDHDTRIVEVIEKLYISGLLFPVQFIGERKGTLNVIVAAKFYWGLSESELDEYKSLVENISMEQNSADFWPMELGMFDRSAGSPHQTELVGLMAASDENVNTYIRNIDNLWRIGNYPYPPNAFSKHIEGRALGVPGSTQLLSD